MKNTLNNLLKFSQIGPFLALVTKGLNVKLHNIIVTKFDVK
jgi:hypothetical protein